MKQKPDPYLTLVKSDTPNARRGSVDLYLTCHRFADGETELADMHQYKTYGYTIVTESGYLLFERVSASTYRFIGFTTVTPKKTDQGYLIFDQDGFYGRFIER